MRVRATSLSAALIIVLGFGASAYATDRPIDGQKLLLRRAGTQAKLVFVSHDPTFLFPAIGGPDDPATGSPGGATIELFSQSEGRASLGAPPGAGYPGWTVLSSPTPRYRFRNPAAPGGISPVRLAVLSQGKVLKVVAKDAGLPLAGPQGAVGIRITTGTLRSCARFTDSTIRKDEAGAFVASHAVASALYNCSDASLNGVPPSCDETYPVCGGTCSGDGVCTPTLSGCVCISPSSPCGQTSPACSGTCPAGEQCVGFGPVLSPTCGCMPVGTTPCGNPGAPVCGGACPSGTGCRPVFALPIFGGGLECACAAPGPCGQGGLDCANGFACGGIPPLPSCYPIQCGGSPTYPTCGGTCGSGATCQPLKVGDTEFTPCVCAIPAPCDASCGGYTCAGGDVCTVSSDPPYTCACGPP